MNAKTTAAILTAAINRHAAGVPSGKSETHDLQSLSRRILAPVDTTKRLLAAGVIRSTGPVHSNDETGRHCFLSSDLNSVRTACLSAITERVIEESDDPAQVPIAAHKALRDHVASFEAKPGAKTEFSRFPRGLVQLGRYGEEEEPSLADRLGTVAKVAGAGALAYGAAGYLRGRMNRPANQLPGINLPGAKGVLADTLAGLRQNNSDVARIAGRIGGAVKPAASALAGSLSSGAAKAAALLKARGMAA